MKFLIAVLLLATTCLVQSNVVADENFDPMTENNVYFIHAESIADNSLVANDEIVSSDDAEVAPMCNPSVTTVSGSHAPGGQICSQQLILNENFNAFDMNLWRHEITMNGGGVSSPII